jgi:3-phenylpropionate/trans-cinnamate dioxygenase ferredoxin reductase component
MRRVVVAGAGMAGVQTAVSLRDEGFTGQVTVVGEEPHPPYDRPPLSKTLLSGAVDSSAFDIDFAALDVELLLGRRAVELRPDRHVLLTDAGPVEYDRLVVATGAEPVPLPGSEDVPGVHMLRTLDDAVALRPVLGAGGRVVVVGAGWIGAEFATAARQAECEVTVVEAAGRPLPGALPAEVTEPMRAWYEAAGVTLRTSAPVAAVEPGAVVLASGERIVAGAVVVGIGARPATGWLAGSGVALGPDRAVLADDRLRASVPDVHAVGDCASFPSARYGTRLLVHHWDNAAQGPRVVAADLMGAEARYDPVPYFWSEQFGRFVQYAGHHGPGDALVWRGSPSDPAWTACWLRDGRLVALLAVGRPRDLAQGRKLIERGTALDRDRVRDAARALRTAVA